MPSYKPKDNTFTIKLQKFYNGLSPSAHLDSLTEDGGAGHASYTLNVDTTVPTYLTQGPGLTDLTNGNQSGVVNELINYIMDRPASDGVTYAISATKLFKVTASSVANTAPWAHTIASATDGESCIEFQGSLYYFYNTSSAGDIGKYDLSSTFTDAWASTVPTGAAALQKAPHPVAKKEDIMLFGNGRYVGTYISSTSTIDVDKLDFGANTEVADVCFHANQWHIAVNNGISGTNRTEAQVYLYDGGATTAILSDEVAVGVQRIGFIMPLNGVVYICYKDLSNVNVFGYISGRRVEPLCYFPGNLPTYEKKTLYKNFVLFESSGLLYIAGASTPKYPYQITQFADGGYATCGGLAAPFGTPMIASTDGATNFRLAKFSGYDTNTIWKSIVFPFDTNLAHIDSINVLTNHAGTGASATVYLEFNQFQATSSSLTLAAQQRLHALETVAASDVEDMRVVVDFSGGSTSNPMYVRKIVINGHWIETPR